MIDFLLKSTLSLGLLYAVYILLLEREKMHKFNRFFLLFSLLFSLIIPFISFEIYVESATLVTENRMQVMPFSSVIVEEKVNYTPLFLWSIYGIVTSILIGRFIINLIKIQRKINSNAAENIGNYSLILLDEKVLPHTFLNNIFINKADYENRKIEEELFSHELTHVRQKHTLDILLIETLKTIFWFNPLFILYKKAIQLNHEFLADENVVTSYNNVPFYQKLLLAKASSNSNFYLASNLNYLVTKKRLIMMTKSTSRNLALLKKATLVPILVALIYFFSVEVIAQEPVISVKNGTQKKESTIADKDKIRDNYYSGVRIILKDTRKNISINKMYEELTLEEKRSYLDWVPDGNIEKEIPAPLFEKMKTKNLAVWINDKISTKAEINKYKRSDFFYYTYSFVHKNARSKRFPQEYQYTIYTKDYFDKNLKNSHSHFSNDTLKLVISDYRKVVKKNSAEEDKLYQEYLKKNKEMNEGQKEKLIDQQSATTLEIEAEKKPDFPGGMMAFYDFVGKNFKVPEAKVSGKVFIQFIIEADGSLSNFEVLRDIGYGTGEEAVRVMKLSPKWIPGEKDGQKVSVQYNLPISIQS
ncbi:M56 family metallopeptidase [Flavobacterium antarcticum]|uniref:M56 family metallopeptidase n=1 Tax=Flavobacterium antarcticum TaxID=271155 RepID=UPI0003B76ABB|nr:M56 family metallopeptidase [Flavobacterium antarcticum]